MEEQRIFKNGGEDVDKERTCVNNILENLDNGEWWDNNWRDMEGQCRGLCDWNRIEIECTGKTGYSQSMKVLRMMKMEGSQS